MKTKLLSILLFVLSFQSFGQAPVIEGDIMMCPNTDGTAYIVTNQSYDSYQWYFKYWFTSDPYVPIVGANGPSLTYDWYNYDQALLKVVVTLGDQTYESNVLQIDSYAWTGLTTGFENTENVSINPENGNVMLCEGTTFTIQVFQPYEANIRWYKDGVLLAGENEMTLEISEPGVYHVEAAPSFCPESMSSSAGTPTIVELNENCDLGTNTSTKTVFKAFPNPAQDYVTVLMAERVSIYSLTGQKLKTQIADGGNTQIDISELSSGIYMLKVEADNQSQVIKILKQ